MTALWLTPDASSTRLERAPLGGGHDERWLQSLLFEHPELVPLEFIEAGDGRFIPLCRELPLPKPTGSVFLDLLGITPQGRPVMVECKLWRNPQARREVVAQILEYAALLRRWNYADLSASLSRFLGPGENPLFAHVEKHGTALDEARFVDAVTRNLRAGDFHLIIAGDGIREDLAAMGERLRDQGARLSLLEVQLWMDQAGHTLVVPHVPLRTEVIRQRLVVDPTGAPIQIAEEVSNSDELIESVIDPDRAEARDTNRAFWQTFIDRVRFDHSDQPPPRHGGNNWTKIPLPSPARWLTVYRYRTNAGLSVGISLVAEDGSGLFEQLAQEADALRIGTGLADLRFHPIDRPDGPPAFGINRLAADLGSEDEQIAWLCDTSNRLVSALRPRLSVMMNA